MRFAIDHPFVGSSECFQNQQVKRALDKVCMFTQWEKLWKLPGIAMYGRLNRAARHNVEGAAS
jgi:hypothetical protein